MNKKITFTPSDIDLTAPLMEGVKAFGCSTGAMTAEEWENAPAAVKEASARHFVPFLWHALPGILEQVNKRIADNEDQPLVVPDTLEGLL